MCQKIILLTCCCLPLWGWTQQPPSPSNDPQVIEKQILELKKRIEQNYLIELQEEVKGQELMIADWQAYAAEVQQVKIKEDEIKDLQKQIKELEARHAQLIQQNPNA